MKQQQGAIVMQSIEQQIKATRDLISQSANNNRPIEMKRHMQKLAELLSKRSAKAIKQEEIARGIQ